MIEFRTSSFCNLGDCVEVGHSPDGSVIVRDSKDAARSASLVFTADEWVAFVRGVKAGEFDAPGVAALPAGAGSAGSRRSPRLG